MPGERPPRTLRPCTKLLRQEHVLVQAWKKTADYIRRHNWFGDTLELDLTAVDLENFLGNLAAAIEDPATWKSTPLRLVLAPKSQDWWVRESCKAQAEPLPVADGEWASNPPAAAALSGAPYFRLGRLARAPESLRAHT